jgi:hypothetical protein
MRKAGHMGRLAECSASVGPVTTYTSSSKPGRSDGGEISPDQQREIFEVDEEQAVAALTLAWADGGYHGFCGDGDRWSAISSAGDVLTGATPDELNRQIRDHWQAMQ